MVPRLLQLVTRLLEDANTMEQEHLRIRTYYLLRSANLSPGSATKFAAKFNLSHFISASTSEGIDKPLSLLPSLEIKEVYLRQLIEFNSLSEVAFDYFASQKPADILSLLSEEQPPSFESINLVFSLLRENFELPNDKRMNLVTITEKMKGLCLSTRQKKELFSRVIKMDKDQAYFLICNLESSFGYARSPKDYQKFFELIVEKPDTQFYEMSFARNENLPPELRASFKFDA